MLVGAAAIAATVALPKQIRAATKEPAPQGGTLVRGKLLPRAAHTVTPLGDGSVLLVGGLVQGRATNSAMLIDTRTGDAVQVEPLSAPRARHAAILLSDGRVLVLGGVGHGFLRTVECFDPMTRTWSHLPGLRVPRADFAVFETPSGLTILGGTGQSGPVDQETYRIDRYR